jgi:hypothetical protein
MAGRPLAGATDWNADRAVCLLKAASGKPYLQHDHAGLEIICRAKVGSACLPTERGMDHVDGAAPMGRDLTARRMDLTSE